MMKENKTYRVLRIDEDIDFGCEEREEGQPVQAVVTLLDENGNECVIKVEDRFLYEKEINEGDEVFFDRDKSSGCPIWKIHSFS